MCWKADHSCCYLVTKLCPTLLWPHMDCSPPGSSVHEILQARILEWVAICFSRGSSRPRDWTQVSRIACRHFTIWATREAYGQKRWNAKPNAVFWHRQALVCLSRWCLGWESFGQITYTMFSRQSSTKDFLVQSYRYYLLVKFLSGVCKKEVS